MRRMIFARRHLSAGKDKASPVIGSGTFRKEGSRVKSWHIRSFDIREDGFLTYGEPGSGKLKGYLNCSSCLLSVGHERNLERSGANDFGSLDARGSVVSSGGVSIAIHSVSENRDLFVVFECSGDAKQFVLWLSKAAVQNNIKAYCASMKWDELLASVGGSQIDSSGQAAAPSAAAGSAAEEDEGDSDEGDLAEDESPAAAAPATTAAGTTASSCNSNNKNSTAPTSNISLSPTALFISFNVCFIIVVAVLFSIFGNIEE